MTLATDFIDLERARALAGLLDRDADDLVSGATLPMMWNLIYFLPRPAQAELAEDGHPLVGFPTPPRPGLRRMFAGGRLTMSPGLTLGSEAVANSYVLSTKERTGRAGQMTFVTTRTEIQTQGSAALVDERDIVYLEPSNGPAKDRQPEPPPGHVPEVVTRAQAAREVRVDPTLLFRFSALTYNAHRIHYDRGYACGVEGHPGLVVHGPLQALLMAETAVGLTGRRDRITMQYKLTAPLYEQQGLFVTALQAGEHVEAQVVDRSGRQTARAHFS